MSYLLFPGRHLVNTRFQEEYLASILPIPPPKLPSLMAGKHCPSDAFTEVIFAVTSSNQENSRYNPVPFHVRAIGVDRFARQVCSPSKVRHRIFGIPHYGQTDNFAAFTIKEIAEQSERSVKLTPENTVVLCSTPEVIKLFQNLGFSIAPAEKAGSKQEGSYPMDVVRRISEAGEQWASDKTVRSTIAAATLELFVDFPEIPGRIIRLHRDPLTDDSGSLTATRDYNTYARGMNSIVKMKYEEIKNGIKPGRIADEGCADGALLSEISRDFPDSDLFGIDLAAEFAHRFQERQRVGDFGGAYVHFFLRNLLDPIFEDSSIDSTLCNSSLHELWSYAEGEKTVRAYLAQKFRQLRPGGRLVIRDVVGPENRDRSVFLECSRTDGLDLPAEKLLADSSRSGERLAGLSTHSRFILFANDYLPRRKTAGKAVEFRELARGKRSGFILDLKTAAEFISKKDYIDNWLSEMNEEFCFWSFPEWKKALADTGFNILENPNQPEFSSRACVNEWIIENRHKNHVRLFTADSDDELPYPPTHMILIAEKPRA